MDLSEHIRNVPDFPKSGIQFKDISTLLLNSDAFRHVIDTWKERYANHEIDVIVGADARGFIFGSTLAYALGIPLALVRKEGKLPAETISKEYTLEYGTATLEIHVDSVNKGDRVLLVDDLLATGGTMHAAGHLVEALGGEIVEMAFVIELPPLKGRELLSAYSVHSLVEFMVD